MDVSDQHFIMAAISAGKLHFTYLIGEWECCSHLWALWRKVQQKIINTIMYRVIAMKLLYDREYVVFT